MEKTTMDAQQDCEVRRTHSKNEEPLILEEIEVEEIFVDGICGVY